MLIAMLAFSAARIMSLECLHADLNLTKEDSAEKILNARTIWGVFKLAQDQYVTALDIIPSRMLPHSIGIGPNMIALETTLETCPS
jgi:hypothetical protein